MVVPGNVPIPMSKVDAWPVCEGTLGVNLGASQSPDQLVATVSQFNDVAP